MRRARLALAAIVALAAGCEVYHGKLYWAGQSPGYLIDMHCEPADVESRPSVRVEVTDDRQQVPLKGASVRFSRKVGARFAFVTGDAGYAEIGLGPGPWDVDVTVQGYRPAHYVLNLPDGHACVLKFRLSIDPAGGISF
ncbi:MAG TPA: carboxypeptidase-like regulatory domain-containing protein [Thermoanaerobaculia bacterium]|jgi:hypothetical protein